MLHPPLSTACLKVKKADTRRKFIGFKNSAVKKALLYSL
jgi:hypothetical protein